MRVLVDTSIWSLILRRPPHKLNDTERRVTDSLRHLTANDRAALIGPVRQELLAGVTDPRQFDRLRELLEVFIDEPLSTPDYERAAELSNACIRAGIAYSVTDMMICSVAVSRDWPIFTQDKDFTRYAKVLPIKLYRA